MKQGNTYIVKIKKCENETWQGVITWVEEGKKQAFRSALELLRLIDTTFDAEDTTEKGE